MPRSLLVVLSLALAPTGSGCATVAGDTLLSELVNDHAPGTTNPPPKRAEAPPLRASAGPGGAACQLASDCRSRVCDHGLCWSPFAVTSPQATSSVERWAASP